LFKAGKRTVSGKRSFSVLIYPDDLKYPDELSSQPQTSNCKSIHWRLGTMIVLTQAATCMHDILFNYIETKAGEKLTDNERVVIESAFDGKSMRKRQYFLREGDVCRYVGFIVKGSARMFSVDEKGQEHIMHFGLESWWLRDQESMINLTPSRYYIEMLEDSELLVISFQNALDLRNKSRCFDLSVQALDRSQTIAMQMRIHATLGMTAEERFSDLSRTYPEFLERFPMNMIASYLGLCPETLSRVRKNAMMLRGS
jgi:CRP-like cAMP-binding protein